MIVAPGHYAFERYDDAERWMSYWHQLRVVLAVRPKTVLEIGPGSGVFKAYLEQAGVTVKTLDIDDARRPDFVGDVTALDTVLPAEAPQRARVGAVRDAWRALPGPAAAVEALVALAAQPVGSVASGSSVSDAELMQ